MYLDGWRRWRDFKGRSGRAEYLVWKVPHWTLIVTLLGIAFAGQEWIFAVLFPYLVISAVPAAALSIRRIHDTGRCGWFASNGLGWPSIGYTFRAGQPGSNAYGPPPEFA